MLQSEIFGHFALKATDRQYRPRWVVALLPIPLKARVSGLPNRTSETALSILGIGDSYANLTAANLVERTIKCLFIKITDSNRCVSHAASTWVDI